MLTLEGRELTEIIKLLSDVIHTYGQRSGELPEASKKSAAIAMDEVVRRLKKLDLPVSIKTAEELCYGCKTYEEMYKGTGLHPVRLTPA